MRDPDGGGHLLALDGARGVAALAVFVYHLSAVAGLGVPIPGSFLAVDLFFLMSGFVIARSYDEKLRSGTMTWSAFVLSRTIRLFPLYVAACAVGGAYFAVKMGLGAADAPSIGQVVTALMPASLLLPNPGALDWTGSEHPFAPSAWSLTLEFWGTLAYAAVCPRLRSWALALGAAVALAILVHEATSFGTLDLGYDTRTLGGGMARFALSFSLGVLAHRHWQAIMPRRRIPLVLVVPAFAFVALPPDAVGAGLAWILVVFPVALVMLASARYPTWAERPLDHLGRLSYGLYIVHAPVILFVAAGFKVALHDEWLAYPALLALACVAAVLTVTTVATYLYDEPVRALMRRRWRRGAVGGAGARATAP